MKYYRTAVLLSWVIVSIFLCFSAVVNGASGWIPFYLVFAAIGGVIPALISAWILQFLARASRLNWSFVWIVYGGFLGILYPLMSRIMIKSVIGPAGIDSVKGFLSFMIFGPAVFLEVSPNIILIPILVGVINGYVLSTLDRPDKSP